ncbi:Ssu-2 homolog (C. elegans) [Apodemus speciosus]|uniref:Ssu-2 homolog (C. elegans) n=1 Tax=Apodemus speciosus TaxID=105296 RepID=A0ABQ0EW01_APOSI
MSRYLGLCQTEGFGSWLGTMAGCELVTMGWEGLSVVLRLEPQSSGAQTRTWLDASTMDRDLSEEDNFPPKSLLTLRRRRRLPTSRPRHRKGMADLSFEAESPVMPPDELLEGLPSYDWLLQGRGKAGLLPTLGSPGKVPGACMLVFSPGAQRVPVVTEEVAREALISFVNSQCCYSSAAAGNLIIQELRQQTLCRNQRVPESKKERQTTPEEQYLRLSSDFHIHANLHTNHDPPPPGPGYRLETFSESRVSEWTFQPVTNHSVDGPQRGTSPRLWDMKVQVPPMFQEDTRKFQVPHSSLVKECHKCHGRGRYKCSGCHGAGTWHQAQSQAAPEMPHVFWLWPAQVQYVLWEGEQDVRHLQGGEEAGALCPAGHHVVKNSLFEFVSPHHLPCPGELLAKARGENLFRDENATVYPIVDFPLQDISLASQRGIEEHSAMLASRARILQQEVALNFRHAPVTTYLETRRLGCSLLDTVIPGHGRQDSYTSDPKRQTIELIPITEVHYWYQGKTSVYYIYGTDHQVYVADYPERYCCGCTIL